MYAYFKHLAKEKCNTSNCLAETRIRCSYVNFFYSKTTMQNFKSKNRVEVIVTIIKKNNKFNSRQMYNH